MAELRPLGAGELLDRAVTIFVRQFVPIVVVVALTLVPTTIAGALLYPHASSDYAQLAAAIGAIGNPAGSRAAEPIPQSPAPGWAFALVVLTSVVHFVMWSALITVVAGAYRGTQVTVGDAYRVGFRRWGAQIVVALAFGVLSGIAMMPVIVAYVLVVIVMAALVAMHVVAATIVVGIVFGLIVLAAFVVVGSWLFMVYDLASVAVVTETSNPMTAIGLALRRCAARGMKRRTIVGGFVVFAVSGLGALPLVGLGMLLSLTTHIEPLYYAVVGAGNVLLEGLIAAFVVVFAIDLRVRREGLDILPPESPAVVA